ncbi:MAG: hypothetical protein SPI59_01400 [Finegoldia sp.]|nr:hypothetical protein [Finegoldia sp.]
MSIEKLGFKDIVFDFKQPYLDKLKTVQGDLGTRGFSVSIISDGEILKPNDSLELRLYGKNLKKKDEVYYTVARANEDGWDVSLSSEMLAFPGILQLQLALMEGDRLLIQSEIADIKVANSLVGANSTIGSDGTIPSNGGLSIDPQLLEDLKSISTLKVDMENSIAQMNDGLSSIQSSITDINSKISTVETAELERVSAEEQRIQAESSRVSAETERANAEQLRVSAETDRVNAELERVSAETDRANSETLRNTAEEERANSELQRAQNERQRLANQENMVANEEARVSAESLRASAESERVTAENQRQAFYEANKSKIENLQEVDTSSFATKEELRGGLETKLDSTALDTFETEMVNALSDKADKSELPDLSKYALKTDIPEGQDLSAYATKLELNDKADKSQLNDYALKTEIPEVQDLSAYALKTDIPESQDLSAYATKVDLESKADKGELPDLSNYALKSDIPEEADLSAYATKTEVTQGLDLKASQTDFEELIIEYNGILDLKADKSDLNEALSFKADKTQLESYALKSEIPESVDTSNLATKDELNTGLDLKVDKTDLDFLSELSRSYPTTTQLNFALSLKADKTQLESYALKTDLSNYALKTDIPTSSGSSSGSGLLVDTLQETKTANGIRDVYINSIINSTLSNLFVSKISYSNTLTQSISTYGFRQIQSVHAEIINNSNKGLIVIVTSYSTSQISYIILDLSGGTVFQNANIHFHIRGK